MSSTPKKHSMFADMNTPVKKARVTAAEAFKIVVLVRVSPLMIETRNSREELNSFCIRVQKAMNSSARKTFGWVSRTKGNIAAAHTIMTCVVKREGDNSRIGSAHYGAGDRHIAEYCQGDPMAVVNSITAFADLACTWSVPCTVEFQGDLVSSLPTTVALKFKFTKRLPGINEKDEDAKLECKGDMWLVATPLSDCYYDLRGDGWTSVADITEDGAAPKFSWWVSATSMVRASFSHHQGSTNVYAAMDVVEQHILASLAPGAVMAWEYAMEVRNEHGESHIVSASDVPSPVRNSPRFIPGPAAEDSD